MNANDDYNRTDGRTDPRERLEKKFEELPEPVRDSNRKELVVSDGRVGIGDTKWEDREPEWLLMDRGIPKGPNIWNTRFVVETLLNDEEMFERVMEVCNDPNAHESVKLGVGRGATLTVAAAAKPKRSGKKRRRERRPSKFKSPQPDKGEWPRVWLNDIAQDILQYRPEEYNPLSGRPYSHPENRQFTPHEPVVLRSGANTVVAEPRRAPGGGQRPIKQADSWQIHPTPFVRLTDDIRERLGVKAGDKVTVTPYKLPEAAAMTIEIRRDPGIHKLGAEGRNELREILKNTTFADKVYTQEGQLKSLPIRPYNIELDTGSYQKVAAGSYKIKEIQTVGETGEIGDAEISVSGFSAKGTTFATPTEDTSIRLRDGQK